MENSQESKEARIEYVSERDAISRALEGQKRVLTVILTLQFIILISITLMWLR